jgi:hypothetical protein
MVSARRWEGTSSPCQFFMEVPCDIEPCRATNFTIVNCQELILYLGFRQKRRSRTVVLHSVNPAIHREESREAAKPDAKSGYIIRPHPYCVFTIMNRKAVMNSHHAITAESAAGPGSPGTAARAYPGLWQGRPVEQFSGIRSSGLYCRHQELIRTGTSVTARCMTRRRSAVHGMRP